jgi:transposase
MLTMYQQITIKTLHKQGQTQADIARELDCHRHTVANVLQRDLIEKQTRTKGSVFDPHQEQIKEWIDKKITILRQFEILTETHDLKSTYVNLCKYIQVRFPKQREAFGVQVVAPGEVGEIDFGYLGMLPGLEGKLVKTYGLAIVLGYSRLGYYAICLDQKLETLCAELTNAFIYFGGVPRRLKVDNMKTAVLRNQHYDLTLNQDFLEFASHYNTVVVPCTPYHPEQKGKVEGAIKYLQINFVAGRVFKDHSDLKQQAKDWMEGYANTRIHGTTRKVPKQVFLEEEADKLQLLPDNEFSFFNRSMRTVAPNCHIHFENNYYSVPANLVGREITVRWNNSLVRIVSNNEQVALHQKARGEGDYVTVRSHLPDYKVYSQTEYQKRVEEQMAAIGESAHAYFAMLLETKDGYWFRSIRGIIGLSKEYGNEAVDLSLKRALYYKAHDLITIKNILEKKLYLVAQEPRLLGEQSSLASVEQSSLFRELSYYNTQNERSVA